MVSSRSKGLANICLLAELALVTAFYWGLFVLWEMAVEVNSSGLPRILLYNEFLLLGWLVGQEPGKRSVFRHDQPERSAGMQATRQTVVSLFFIFGAALAVGDRDFPRDFLFSFGALLLPISYGCKKWMRPALVRWFLSFQPPTRVLLAGDLLRVHRVRDWLESKREVGFVPVGIVTHPPEPGRERAEYGESSPAGQSGARNFLTAAERGQADFSEQSWNLSLSGSLRGGTRPGLHGPEMGAATAQVEPAVPDIRPAGLPILGRLDELDAVLERHEIDQVVLLELISSPELLATLIRTCERRAVRLVVVNDLEERFRHSVLFFRDGGLPLIGLRDEPLEDPVNRGLKRLIDFVIALGVVLLVLPWVSVLVWFLQRWQSPGPLIFAQDRAGLQNRPFRIFKFRTMHPNHGEEARQAELADRRVYPAGAWLRKLSLDELPQFVNVLRGEMSVVGPRPHLTEHNDAFAQAMDNYHVRTMVKPGITGLAQVKGFRGETRTASDIVKRVSSDIEYLENWSLSLDVRIILNTVRQIIFPPPNAY